MEKANNQEKMYDTRRFGKYDENRLRKYVKHIEKFKNPLILDVGCGEGQLFDSLIKYKKDIIYEGMDLSGMQLKIAEKKGIKTYKHDLEKRFPQNDNTYDIILATEVIEHLFDTTFFLNECNRVLKKGGILILTTPNTASLMNRARLLFGNRPRCLEYKAEADKNHNNSGHIRAFVRHELLKHISKNGFRIIEDVGRQMGLSAFSKIGLPKFKWIDDKLCEMIPQFSDGFIVIAKKNGRL